MDSTSNPPAPGGRPFAGFLVQPLARFLRVEAAGGIVLLVATGVALLWANSPWSAGYHDLWRTAHTLDVGPLHMHEDLQHWVNSGLMTLFFFVVGLEIKRELVDGQLSDRRDVALPVIAAIGGMVVPAAIFLSINSGRPGSVGWGIPMATDIAFALGVLTLLGDRIPSSLGVLLLGLAIADDIGAIIVIATFYSEDVSLAWLGAAVASLALVAVMRRVGVTRVSAYVAVGVIVWMCTLASGVHATIAGVALGLLTPAVARVRPETDSSEIEETSVAARLETTLHPWTSYVVIPVFALANAGVPLSLHVLRLATSSRITFGVAAGLVVGKIVGISAFSWVAVRLGAARLPRGVEWRHIVGLAGVAGIGFTVSIFVTGLAFTDPSRQREATIGVLAASLAAAAIGSLVLALPFRGSDTNQ